MIGRSALSMCLGLAAAVAARGGDAEIQFQYQKDVIRPEAAADEIVAAPLDDDVYAATRDGFPDVRLIDDHNAEVPFLVESIGRPRRTIVVRETCPARVESLRVEEGKALEVVVALDKDAVAADGATIRTPLTDFERRVRIYGDRDGGWVPLTEDGRIFDYARFMNVRNLEVALPLNACRRYRLVIEHEQDERESPLRELIRDRGRGIDAEVASNIRRPFRIDRIDLWRNVKREGGAEDSLFSQPLAGIRVANDAVRKETWVDVAAGRRPLSGLRLKTSSRNFSRSVRVLVPFERDGRQDWTEIGRGTLAMFDFRNFHRDETTIDFPERRVDRLRLVIENADNPQLEVTGIDGRGSGRRITFLGEPGRRYRLFYGAGAVEAPRYDAPTVLHAIGRGRATSDAALGPQRANLGYRPTVDWPRPFDGGPALVLAVIVMVVVLAWAIATAGRRLKKPPTDAPGD